MLDSKKIDTSKICGLVFDTTSVNSGVHKGVAVQLEEHLAKSLLQFACRHHVAELWGGAACRVIYGETTSPEESCFKALCSFWSKVDVGNYRLPRIQGRFLKGLQSKVLKFLDVFLAAETCTLRHDYRELAELTLLMLGGTLGKGITVKAPGATHHARWMAAMIYTFKITLFRDQLGEVFDNDCLDNIEELGVFLALFYVRYWLCCGSGPDAPAQDLALLSLLESAIDTKLVSVSFKELVQASLDKLVAGHLWYLSERLVPLALFSDHVSHHDKSMMAKQSLIYRDDPRMTRQQHPLADRYSTKKLKDFVGPDSMTFFERYGVNPTFLTSPVSSWDDNTDYRTLSILVRGTSVINDCAERALGLLTEFNCGKVTHDEMQRQALLQVVRHMRRQQSAASAGTERCTKKSIINTNYKK